MDEATSSGGGHLRIAEHELQSRLAEVLRDASNGTSFLVMSADRVVAELRPPPLALSHERGFGALRGKIVMAPNFDTFPEDMLDIMEGPL